MVEGVLSESSNLEIQVASGDFEKKCEQSARKEPERSRKKLPEAATATPTANSALRSAAAAAAARTKPSVASAELRRLPPRRSFSSAAHHDDASEAEKWEKITYAGIITCTILTIYNLRKGHHHYPDPPPYPYLHIRNKEFPWGPDSLFESMKKKHSDH
ncbi:cytochrome c oxidase subunit 6a, mitochondrial-like [Ananas comosus]|uniref:Cytochrome c oxidase subunit 6a, mitochondrial-like n=1 Tax=Ananas comosus TaxID=4615 RepID=A0A6P5FJ67_ANACO|nr:cytochrome c oxidase subunit 6a, mitochondrial-like [Ananas comosus]